MLRNKKILISLLAMVVLLQSACSSTKQISASKEKISPGSEIAIIVDSRNNVKNAIMAKFMEKGYKVTAFNASDLYSMSDIFDIRDLKKVSYKVPGGLASMEKTYNNIYKLHLYNFEINKATLLEEMKTKWGVQYLILVDLQNWEETSWARAINLRTYEIVWLENYPTQYGDDINSVMDHFIAKMSGK